MADIGKEFEKLLVDPVNSFADQYKNYFMERCLDFLKKRFRDLPYPLKVNNEDVSKVHPSEIARCLEIVDTGNGNKIIKIVSSNPDVEWSAKRYAFLTQGNDPFAELRQRIDAGLNI